MNFYSLKNKSQFNINNKQQERKFFKLINANYNQKQNNSLNVTYISITVKKLINFSEF